MLNTPPSSPFGMFHQQYSREEDILLGIIIFVNKQCGYVQCCVKLYHLRAKSNYVYQLITYRIASKYPKVPVGNSKTSIQKTIPTMIFRFCASS